MPTAKELSQPNIVDPAFVPEITVW